MIELILYLSQVVLGVSGCIVGEFRNEGTFLLKSTCTKMR